MPTLVQIGAGNIGRGFVAPLFTAAGWSVVFVDLHRGLVGELQRRGSYTVHEVDNDGEVEVPVGPVTAIHATEHAAVVAALVSCDLAATAVGLAALPALGPLLAEAAARRSAPLDVLICENGIDAHERLRAAVGVQAGRLGLVRTSIGRMIPAPVPGGGGDTLDIVVEPYGNLPVERSAFRGAVPAVRGIDAADDFDLIIRQKQFLANLTHACLAYAGARKQYATIAECAADARLAAGVRAAGFEAAEALARAHGRTEVEKARIRRENRDLVDDLLDRCQNRRLGDPVARVGRDPWRKLGAEERLVGAARLCLAQRVTPQAIVRHLLDALQWQPEADEPQAEHWRTLQAGGPVAHLQAVTALSSGDPLLVLVAEVLAEQRRQAAGKALKAAGVVLGNGEAARLRVEDFGAGDFAAIGVVTLTYVTVHGCESAELVLSAEQRMPEEAAAGTVVYRCRAGEATVTVVGRQPQVLQPGDQAQVPAGVAHALRAGAAGAVCTRWRASGG
jgi:mannitol-1-phosphate 5-dehydrogenase